MFYMRRCGWIGAAAPMLAEPLFAPLQARLAVMRQPRKGLTNGLDTPDQML